MTMAARAANLAPASFSRSRAAESPSSAARRTNGNSRGKSGGGVELACCTSFVESGEFPGLKDHGRERGFESLIVGAQDGGDGAAADPVAEPSSETANPQPPARAM